MKRLLRKAVLLSILTFGLLVTTGEASASDLRGWHRSYQTSEIIGLWVMNHQER